MDLGAYLEAREREYFIQRENFHSRIERWENKTRE
jgi:hypothetical protein